MSYERELIFFQRILDKFNIRYHLLTDPFTQEEPLDLGFRRFLGRQEEYSYLFHELLFKSDPAILYKLTDHYFCNYIYFRLPEKEDTLFLLGPYLAERISYERLMQDAERFMVPPHLFSQLEDYYGMIPVYQDDRLLLSSLNAFAETVFGSSDAYTMKILEDETKFTNPSVINETSPIIKETLLTMEDMEKRYIFENQLLHAVSLGMTHKATQMIRSFSEMALKKRVSDPLRNNKNYCIIMNTLLRKAAEKGSVHPLYLDKVSSEYAAKIELVTSLPSVATLMTDMIVSYCRLVNRHSYDKYTRTIQKILVTVDADLTSDLSLHTLAKEHAISPGYLSALFKKEVGKTLTDYVNERRMKHGAQLLTTTNLQVQTIAQYCGMSDVNYFSKTFRRYYNHPPKEYRRLNHISTMR